MVLGWRETPSSLCQGVEKVKEIRWQGCWFPQDWCHTRFYKEVATKNECCCHNNWCNIKEDTQVERWRVAAPTEWISSEVCTVWNYLLCLPCHFVLSIGKLSISNVVIFSFFYVVFSGLQILLQPLVSLLALKTNRWYIYIYVYSRSTYQYRKKSMSR